MKNLVPFILIVFVFSVNAQTKSSNKSAPLTPDSPESVGMSSERLDRIDAICQEAVKSRNLPGIVALVAGAAFNFKRWLNRKLEELRRLWTQVANTKPHIVDYYFKTSC